MSRGLGDVYKRQRHEPKAVAEAIIQIICDDLKFKDKQNDPEYVMLNSRLKQEKKRKKNARPIFDINKKKHTNKHEKRTSKFNEKYKERIESIKTSDEQIAKNRINARDEEQW